MTQLCEVCNWPDEAWHSISYDKPIICDDCWLVLRPIILTMLRKVGLATPKPADVETVGSKPSRYKDKDSAFAGGLQKGAWYIQNSLYLEKHYKAVRAIRGVNK